MSLAVLLTPAAEDDVEEAAQWYEQRRDGLGRDLVRRVRDTLDRIRANPQLYPEVHFRVRRAPVRRFPFGVFYRVNPANIEVIGVFHDRRDPTVWNKRV